MILDYTLTGRIVVPDGSKLTATGTGITLPDGRVLKIWEQLELGDANGECCRELDYSDAAEKGIFYDGDMVQFEIVDEETDERASVQIWPPNDEQFIDEPTVGIPIGPPEDNDLSATVRRWREA